MGCNLHMVAQRRDESGHWKTLDIHYDEPRWYFLYYVMAGVRDKPEWATLPIISVPRGLPKELEIVDPEDNDVHVRMPSGKEKWLGQHSFSWLTVAEIVEYLKISIEKRVMVAEKKCVTLKDYLAYQRDGTPIPSWISSISGNNIIILRDSDFNEDFTVKSLIPADMKVYVNHVDVSPAIEELGYLPEWCEELRKKFPDTNLRDLRLVFGFDN